MAMPTGSGKPCPSPRRAIAAYYDAITPILMSPARRRAGTMHQELWAPGVTDRDAALLYLTELVAAAIAPVLGRAPQDAGGRPLILDLGCGVGGAAIRLAGRFEATVVGLTLSPVQARRMRARARDAGVAATCHVVVADYYRPPLPRGARAAYALESFTHARDPGLLLRRVAADLAPGGRFVLCDDFITDAPCTGTQRGVRDALMAGFRRGWRLSGLTTCAAVTELARDAGLTLIEDRDLSPFLPAQSRPGALMRRIAGRIFATGAFAGAVLGGAALRACQDRGWIEKRFLVFEAEQP